MKINAKQPFVDIGKQETYEQFQQKKSNLMVFEARQIFQLFRQITRFLRNNGPLSKFSYRILHFLISIINYKKMSP